MASNLASALWQANQALLLLSEGAAVAANMGKKDASLNTSVATHEGKKLSRDDEFQKGKEEHFRVSNL